MGGDAYIKSDPAIERYVVALIALVLLPVARMHVTQTKSLGWNC